VHYLAAGIISLSLILTNESLSAVLWRSHLVVGHLPLNLVTYTRLKSGNFGISREFSVGQSSCAIFCCRAIRVRVSFDTFCYTCESERKCAVCLSRASPWSKQWYGQ